MIKITRQEIASRMTAPYEMSFMDGSAESRVVLKCINVGIDSHLEACMVPARGDSYRVEKTIVGNRIHFEFSKESLPVLLRRLTELEYTGKDGDDCDIGGSLATGILESLDFEVETGCYQIITIAESDDCSL